METNQIAILKHLDDALAAAARAKSLALHEYTSVENAVADAMDALRSTSDYLKTRFAAPEQM